MTNTIEYINWYNSANWKSNIILGSDGKRYDFSARWNVRDDSWYISVEFEGSLLLSGVGLRLNTNLLDGVYNKNKPNCLLYTATDNANIERITYDNMIDGSVKLYHILPEVLL